MDNSIHSVKRIVKGEIVENTLDNKGQLYYYMKISIISDVLGRCQDNRDSNKTVFGNMEVETELTLFADTKEALEIKAEVLTTEEG